MFPLPKHFVWSLVRTILFYLPHSKNLLDDLPSKNLGGAFWNVKKDPDHDGHFQTFKMITEKKEPFKPDEDLQLEVGRCHLQNCFYVFHSKAEKRRHLRLVHKMISKCFDHCDGSL